MNVRDPSSKHNKKNNGYIPRRINNKLNIYYEERDIIIMMMSVSEALETLNREFASIGNKEEEWKRENQELKRKIMELEGKNIYELFSSGSPFNFDKFKNKPGATAQTLLNHIDVIIHNNNTNLINLFVRRSFSEHLCSWISDSARFL